MSTTYQPGHIPEDTQQLVAALRSELAAIKKGLEDAAPSHRLQVLHAAPARLVAGMLVIADGVDYNPGSGEGLYRRDKTNASWVFIG